MITVGIISTSRADFGIYLPLLRKMQSDRRFQLKFFVGGMHTSEAFGNTYQFFEKEGFEITEKLAAVHQVDSPQEMAKAMVDVQQSYAVIWESYHQELDCVLVLGDRYEMFAATSSLLPFNLPIGHIHGGEITLGALDNKFRNAITMLSDIHFTSHEAHAKNVISMQMTDKNVHNVGALGIEAAKAASILKFAVFEQKYNVSIEEGFILSTFHPDTINLGNLEKVNELIAAFKQIPLKVLCTLPNADMQGKVIRERLLEYEKQFPEKMVCFENLGQLGYYSAMAYCKCMIGNSSSGIIEASAFDKWVINVGDRQKGRYAGNNVKHVVNSANKIVEVFNQLDMENPQPFDQVYGKGNTSTQIMDVLVEMYEV